MNDPITRWDLYYVTNLQILAQRQPRADIDALRPQAARMTDAMLEQRTVRSPDVEEDPVD